MNSFKPGDVVRLRSGGPDMTVKFVENRKADEGDNVFVTWFPGSMGDWQNQCENSVFNSHVLCRVESEKS